jgi:hypothetical protein
MQALRGQLDPPQARAPPSDVGEGAAHDERIGAHRTEVDRGAGQPGAGDAIDLDEIGVSEVVNVVGDGAVLVAPAVGAGHAHLEHVGRREAVEAVQPRRRPMRGHGMSTNGQRGRLDQLMPAALGTGDDVDARVSLVDPAVGKSDGEPGAIELQGGSLAT